MIITDLFNDIGRVQHQRKALRAIKGKNISFGLGKFPARKILRKVDNIFWEEKMFSEIAFLKHTNIFLGHTLIKHSKEIIVLHRMVTNGVV